MGSAPVKIERLSAKDAERYRAIRLRALADTPDAFAALYAEEAALAAEYWHAQVSGDAAHFIAVLGGADVGMVTGEQWDGRERDAGLFGMWVAPEARCGGAGAALVGALVDWARTAGFERLVLHVADANRPALALYKRFGFQATGVTSTLPAPREHVAEHERALVF